MCNRSSAPQEFDCSLSDNASDSLSDTSYDSLAFDSSDMSWDGHHGCRTVLDKCPVCLQTFNLADLSDVPAPHNFGLSRHLDYARRLITREVYLAGRESEHESDHECDHEGDHESDHSSSERPIVPDIVPEIAAETCNNHLVDRGIFVSFFEVFAHRTLETSPEYVFLVPQDMRSFSALSLRWFVSLQPALRVRRWQAVSRATDFKATLLGNVDLVKFDKGVVYKCNLCCRHYAVVVLCTVCPCMFCDTCHRVQPRYLPHFNNQSFVCLCPWAKF